MLRKFNLNTTLIKCKFEDHKNIIEDLIKLIDSQKADEINVLVATQLKKEFHFQHYRDIDQRVGMELKRIWSRISH